MLFNSLNFIFFFSIFFILYWSIQKYYKTQNILILIGSYVFYGFWNYKFLTLIIASTSIDFFIGKLIVKYSKYKKILLSISILSNIGILVIFKYLNFFIDSFQILLQSLNYNIQPVYLELILPVGISFYSFQTLSYTIDIYKNKLKPSSNFISFAAFVAFFPQLVAGPIERASNLLPQINSKRVFNFKNSTAGLYLFLLGLIKKVVIADTVSPHVNYIYSNIETTSSIDLILGTFLFGIQIYGDFSGYSDMAIGISKMLGFDLMTNFKTPYLSKNINEFWKRWHISLSTFFRDYLYIPLGGSRINNIISFKNILIVFIVSGLWHGANWTFIFWGLFHAILYIPHYFKIIPKSNSFKYLSIFKTFFLVNIGWIFFRSESVNHALEIFKKILTFDISINHDYNFSLLLIPLTFIIDKYIIKDDYKLENIKLKYPVLILSLIVIIILNFWGSNNSFIYFQF